ncbi:MAG: protein kinase, partial [Myxococcota bacterium]|nr:protein kinase [Myxococcota bacterium]
MEPEQLREKTWLPVGIVLEERWVLGEPLGRGGFASVYEARHLKLGRRAAVKVLDLQANPDDLKMLHERFLREAKLSSQLEHPNVVQILDFGLYEHNG